MSQPDATNNAEELSDRVFKALSSRSRRQILLTLACGAGSPEQCSTDEVCACDLSEAVGLGASTVSHHMKALQEAGLVSARKEGLWVYYALRPETIAAVIAELQALSNGCCVPPAPKGEST